MSRTEAIVSFFLVGFFVLLIGALIFDRMNQDYSAYDDCMETLPEDFCETVFGD